MESKSFFFFVYLVGATVSQTVLITRPRINTYSATDPMIEHAILNSESQCGVSNRNCNGTDICVQAQVNFEFVNQCERLRGVDESCAEEDFIGGERDDFIIIDDHGISFERIARERGLGARERETASTLNGVWRQIPCENWLSCVKDRCTAQGALSCRSQKTMDSDIRCDADGLFEPIQCSRLPGETRNTSLAALDCHCVHPMTGIMLNNTGRRVTRRNDLLDCYSHDNLSCPFMWGNHQIVLRHKEAFPSCDQTGCMKCKCMYGSVACTPVQPVPDYALSERTASCQKDNQTINHGEQITDEWCNRCGCRDGILYCTRLPRCRYNDTEVDSIPNEVRMCEECNTNFTPRSVVHAKGDQFPSLCHAMRCYGIAVADISQVGVQFCSSTPCGSGFGCIESSIRGQMSRQNFDPEAGRFCVNRTNLLCRQQDGSNRILSGEDDIIEKLRENDVASTDDDNRAVCSRGISRHASTCHLSMEYYRTMSTSYTSSVYSLARSGCFNTFNAMVCGLDGRTYQHEDSLHIKGGNTRIDYSEPCLLLNNEEDVTLERKCDIVRNWPGLCPEVSSCSKIVQPTEGCCPICGGIVLMALDQRAVDEHVAIIDSLRYLDSFLAGFLRDGGGTVGPVISTVTVERCEISITRPNTIYGDPVEVTLQAKTGNDADFCHTGASQMAWRLNNNEGPQFLEEYFVAAAIAVPLLESEAPPRPTPTPTQTPTPTPLPTPTPTVIETSGNQVGNGGKRDLPGLTTSGLAISGALLVIFS